MLARTTANKIYLGLAVNTANKTKINFGWLYLLPTDAGPSYCQHLKIMLAVGTTTFHEC